MGKKVPHCTECEKMKCVHVIYKEYYCQNEDGELKGLGVDNPPKTSPKWCPKREEVK